MTLHVTREQTFGAAVLPLLLVLLCMPLGVEAAVPIVMNQHDISSWQDVERIPPLSPIRRAREAVLWGDPKVGDHGILNEWGSNIRSGWQTRASDTRIVVVRGTLVVNIEGQRDREIDAGGFAFMPRGVKHNFGCTGMGRCTFMLYQSGPAGIQAAAPPARR